MRALALSLSAIIGTAAACQGSGNATDAPASLSVPTSAEELAERIVNAHGGAERWGAISAMSYEHQLEFPGAERPWISRETIEQSPTRRLYHDYPSHGGSLTWDGNEVWTVDWSLDNPPRLMPFLSYYSLITPFLTLHEGVELEGPGLGKLPKDDREYLTLTLRLPKDESRPPTAGYYTLFADKATYEVKGVAYNVVFGRLLDLMEMPADVEQMGPMTHVFTETATVDGILVPTAYWTQSPNGGVAGRHVARNWSFKAEFDESRMKKPDNAVVDYAPYSRVEPSEGRSLAMAMVAAHGGMEAWTNADALSFVHKHRVGDDPNIWLSHEIIDRRTGRAYLEWPREGATMAANGRETWSTNWHRELPASFLARLTYDFVGAPWLVQNPGLTIGEVGEAGLPCYEDTFKTLDILPGPAGSLGPGVLYRLYLHPTTDRLQAIEFDIQHPALVKPGAPPMGPMLHVFREFVEVQGLTMPAHYSSFSPMQRDTGTAHCTPIAEHWISETSLSASFPEEKMTKPAAAIVDPAPERSR